MLKLKEKKAAGSPRQPDWSRGGDIRTRGHAAGWHSNSRNRVSRLSADVCIQN